MIPDVTIMDMQFDWKGFYANFSLPSTTLHGFTSTYGDPACVSAFRIKRTSRGVEVFYKESAGLASHWRGIGGQLAIDDSVHG